MAEVFEVPPGGVARVRVGFSHTRGFWLFLSKVIMWATRRPYSHVFFLLEGAEGFRGQPCVFEASGSSVHLVPWSTYQAKNVVVKLVDPPRPLDRGLDAAFLKLGESFDDAGLVGMSWVLLMRRWLHHNVPNPLRSQSEMWCSELAAFVFQQSGNYPLAENIPVFDVSTRDIETLLELQGVT